MNRKNFIQQLSALGVGGYLSASPMHALAKGPEVTLTILHTNDWHSRIEPFPMDGSSLQGRGGAEARAALIKSIRSTSEHVLLLDAGDIFQGTPYFNYFNGELEYKLMSAMGYDCATLGNHDFDNGIEGILHQLPHATFSFVNCNYDFSKTKLQGIVKPYRIFKKGPLKIGVFGVGIDLNGLVPEKLFSGVVYRDPVEQANAIATTLKYNAHCDLVICLSHLGYEYKNDKISDVKLAQQTNNIDLIIGGHTHTFLQTPVTQVNSEGKPVLINQVGWAGVQLGRIDYTLKPFTDKEFDRKHATLEIGF